MLVLQFLLGFILLRTTAGTTIVSGLAGVFDALLRFAGSGVDFVLAYTSHEEGQNLHVTQNSDDCRNEDDRH
jgi:nucleoside permease NupC